MTMTTLGVGKISHCMTVPPAGLRGVGGLQHRNNRDSGAPLCYDHGNLCQDDGQFHGRLAGI